MEKNVVLIAKGERELKQWAREIRMKNEVEALNLTTTRELINAWRSVVGNGYRTDQELSEFEAMILDHAKEEWGPGTTVEFNRDKITALVTASHGISMEIGA